MESAKAHSTRPKPQLPHGLSRQSTLQQLKLCQYSYNFVAFGTNAIVVLFCTWQCIFEGIPLLQTLNLYGNKISEVHIPTGPEHLLNNLCTLDLGFNSLVFLCEDLACLPALKILRVPNNSLCMIPARICFMKSLKSIDVACNPVTEPPIETCERGLKSMKRYWLCWAQEACNVATADCSVSSR